MLVMEYIELGSLSSYLQLHEDELVEETNRLLKYSLDIAQVILNFVFFIIILNTNIWNFAILLYYAF